MSAVPAPELSGGERYAVIWYAAQLSHMIGPLAQALYDLEGIRTVIACLDRNAFVRPAEMGLEGPAIADVVELGALLEPRPRDEVDARQLAEQAREFESRTGVLLREVVRSDRHFGVDYLSGGIFPRSAHAADLDDIQVMDIALRLCQACEETLLKWQPLFVLCYPGMITSMALSEVAQRMDIPLRGLAKGRKKREQFHWLVNKYASWWGLDEAVAARIELDKTPVDEGEGGFDMGAPFRMQVALDTLRADASLRGLIRKLDGITRRTIVNKLRNRAGYGSYRYLDNLFYVVRMWWWRRQVTTEKIEEATALGPLSDGRPFIFYPLQTEPESNLMAEAPMCDNQLTVIDWLCKAAPAGWSVAVKDHPGALAPKPPGFMERLRRYPNLVLLPTLASGEAVAARAEVVAVINGTLGLQAAIAGLPVLCYHPHYQGRCVPHMLFADSYPATVAALRRIRDGDIPSLAERRRCGRAYSDALDDCSFEVTDEKLIHGRPGPQPVGSDDATVLATTLLRSLEPPSRYGGVMAPEYDRNVLSEARG